MRNILSFGAGVAALLVATSAQAQIINAAVEGDNVAGVGTLTRIDNIAINSLGQWSVEADTNFSNSDEDSVLLGGFQDSPFSLLLREGQALTSPPGATLDGFDSVTLNDNGAAGYNFFLDGTPFGEDSGVYLNSNLVIQESDISTAPQFTPGTPLIGIFDVKINNATSLLILGSYDDPNINSSVDRALVRVDNAGGAFTETVIIKEGDLFDDTAVLDFATGPHDTALANNGSIIFVADLDSGSSSNDLAIGIDDMVIAREGSASPIAGRNYEFLSRAVDLNSNGDYVFRANLDGDTADDDVIVKNGVVIAQEGMMLPGLGTLDSLGSSSGPVQIDEDGNVLWYAEWIDDIGGGGEGLFLNDELIVQIGDLVDGVALESISGGEEGFKLSDFDQWVIFEGDLVGGLNGAFVLQVPSPGCVGDISGNGVVDGGDLNILLSNWQCPIPADDCQGSDLNGDGNVDGADLNILLSDFGCTS